MKMYKTCFILFVAILMIILQNDLILGQDVKNQVTQNGHKASSNQGLSSPNDDYLDYSAIDEHGTNHSNSIINTAQRGKKITPRFCFN